MTLAPLAILLDLSMRASSPEPTRAFSLVLQRLDVSSALVVSSQAVDEHPVWSPDGRFLAVSVDEEWSKLDLGPISLIKGTWHDGDGIGVVDPPASLAPIPESEVRAWRKSARYGARSVTTKTGTIVELEQAGLGTVFRMTRKGREPVVLWKTSLENCHGLALSPDETLVAFVCELNGVILTTLE